ncbi:mediator complex subunit 24 isoform X2 [Oratosquilla oratoria]
MQTAFFCGVESVEHLTVGKMVMEQVTSSKAGTIRSLLIRAWRERWSDLQWGIHIKTVLPRCVSGDIYHLADCILQQALMGPLPNHLIFSYLKHSLSSQVVSYGGVLGSISKYDSFQKPHCVHALLTLMQSMMKTVSCRGKPEDCLMLASSLVGSVKWLIQVMSWATHQVIDLRIAPEHTTNLNLATAILQEVLNNPFLTCMLEIGRREDQSVWNECLKNITQLETQLGDAGGAIENRESVINCIVQLRDLNPLSELSTGGKRCDAVAPPLCYAIHSLVVLEVLIYTTRQPNAFAHRLLLLKKLKGLSNVEFYHEILKASFIGLSYPEQRQYQELKWVSFVFIKVPTLLYTIHLALTGENSTTASTSDDLLVAIKRVAAHTMLMDQVDTRMNCNCLEYLLNEICTKTKLILEKDAQTIIAFRVQDSNVLGNLLKNESQGPNPGNPNLILRAQPTVASILKTLNQCNQDSILPVMYLLIGGKSRKLVLAAAAASGSLHLFAQKFIKINEMSMEPQTGELQKSAHSRAMVFDISMMLLTLIAQVFGIDVVLSEKCETFVEQWLRENLPEPGIVKSPLGNVHVDATTIEDFLRQVNTPDSDIKNNQVTLSQVCKVAAVALREVVEAAQQGAVSTKSIKELLDRLKHHLCCLPICITAWLCSFIQMVDGEKSSKPNDLLHFLQSCGSVGAEDKGQQGQTGDQQTYLKDRLFLMTEIIKNMVQDTKGSPSLVSNQDEVMLAASIGDVSSSHKPLSQLLGEAWKEVFATGILTPKALANFQWLLRLGGTKWFVQDLVRVGMECVFEAELNRAIDLIYGLLHLDPVGCTLSLLVHTLPAYITAPSAVEILCEPRGTALSRLSVMLVMDTWYSLQQPTTPIKSEPGTSTPAFVPQGGGGGGVKRTYHDREMEDLQTTLHQHSAELAICGGLNELGRDATALLVAVHSLLKLMTQVSRSGVMSPVTQMMTTFLHQLVCAPDSHIMLTLVPPSLVPNLIPLLTPPYDFSYPELLDLSAPKPLSSSINSPTTVLGTGSDIGVLGTQTPAQAAGSRRAAAKLLCVQRNLLLASHSI